MSLVAYHQKMVEHASIKRFFERSAADSRFRQAVKDDPAAALFRIGLKLHTDDLDPLSSVHQSMIEVLQEKERWVHHFYHEETLPSHTQMSAWRRRQISRQLLDLGPFANFNIQAPFCFELTQGCSVGCWFCSLSPDHLQGIFRHDESNAQLWRSILRLLKKKFGPAASAGFLYWATEPFDNPDYEKFCLDFYEILGIFPPTTTALALKNPARTRALLRLAEERDCWLNRFSVLSIRMMERIHEEFTAEELAMVECLPLNQESAFAFANSGRFRERTQSDPSLLEEHHRRIRMAPWFQANPGYREANDYPFASSACVTGFLFNMVTRNVKLISPCTSDDRWPLGYVVFGEGDFTGIDDLEILLDELINNHMRSVNANDRIGFHDWLRYETLPAGFKVSGRFGQSVQFCDPNQSEALRDLGESIRTATYTASEIASDNSKKHNISSDLFYSYMNQLLEHGVLQNWIPNKQSS